MPALRGGRSKWPVAAKVWRRRRSQSAEKASGALRRGSGQASSRPCGAPQHELLCNVSVALRRREVPSRRAARVLAMTRRRWLPRCRARTPPLPTARGRSLPAVASRAPVSTRTRPCEAALAIAAERMRVMAMIGTCPGAISPAASRRRLARLASRPFAGERFTTLPEVSPATRRSGYVQCCPPRAPARACRRWRYAMGTPRS
jgi:hypothetical protein